MILKVRKTNFYLKGNNTLNVKIRKNLHLVVSIFKSQLIGYILIFKGVIS